MDEFYTFYYNFAMFFMLYLLIAIKIK